MPPAPGVIRSQSRAGRGPPGSQCVPGSAAPDPVGPGQIGAVHAERSEDLVAEDTGERLRPADRLADGRAPAAPVGTWMLAHQLTSSALIDAFIFLALAMVLTRTGSLVVRSRLLRAAPPAALTAADSKSPASSADQGQRAA